MRKLLVLAAVFALAAAFAVAQEKPAKGVKPGEEAGKGTVHKSVGITKCKMCHKLQYESWLKTKHATAKPPLECEGCHGPGADYVPMPVMKDAAKAKAAGLIIPDEAFCTAKCHKADKFDKTWMPKTHDHKPKPADKPASTGT